MSVSSSKFVAVWELSKYLVRQREGPQGAKSPRSKVKNGQSSDGEVAWVAHARAKRHQPPARGPNAIESLNWNLMSKCAIVSTETELTSRALRLAPCSNPQLLIS